MGIRLQIAIEQRDQHTIFQIKNLFENFQNYSCMKTTTAQVYHKTV